MSGGASKTLTFKWASDTRGAEAGFQRMGGATTKLVGALGGLLAVHEVSDFLHESVSAAMANQKAMSQLQNQVNKTSDSWGKSGEEIQHFLDKSVDASGFMKTDLTAGLTRLVTATHDVTKSQQLLGTAEDLARARGMDLTTASQLVSKVYNGNAAAAKKLGLQTTLVTQHQDRLKRKHMELIAAGKKLTDSQKLAYAEALKTAKAEDKRASGLATLKTIQEQFKGSTEAYAHTSAGAAERLKAQWEEFQVAIGDRVLPVLVTVFGWLADKLPGAISKLNAGINAGIAFFTRYKEVILPIAAALGTIIGLYLVYVKVTKLWMEIQKAAIALQVAWNALLVANPIGIIIVAIAAFIAIMVVLYTRHKAVRDKVHEVWEDVKRIIGGAVSWVANKATAFYNAAVSVGKSIYDGIMGGVDTLIKDLKAIVSGAINAVKWYINTFYIAPANAVIGVANDIPHPGIPNIPRIPTLARGGIVMGPTIALIGEAGPEAVVPLGRGGGGAGIVVNVNKTGADPREIGAAVSWALRVHA